MLLTVCIVTSPLIPELFYHYARYAGERVGVVPMACVDRRLSTDDINTAQLKYSVNTGYVFWYLFPLSGAGSRSESIHRPMLHYAAHVIGLN